MEKEELLELQKKITQLVAKKMEKPAAIKEEADIYMRSYIDERIPLLDGDEPDPTGISTAELYSWRAKQREKKENLKL